MKTTETLFQIDRSETTSDTIPRTMRGDLLTGLELARRSLDNAKQDIELGISIDPSLITKFERVVAEYEQMLATRDRKHARKL